MAGIGLRENQSLRHPLMRVAANGLYSLGESAVSWPRDNKNKADWLYAVMKYLSLLLTAVSIHTNPSYGEKVLVIGERKRKGEGLFRKQY